MIQDSKGKPSALTHSTASLSKYTDSHPATSFSQSQPDKFPLKPEEFDRKALLAALNAYITQKEATKNLDGSSRTKESSPYTSRLKPPQTDYLDGTLSKEKPGDFEMSSPFLQQFGTGLGPGSAQNDQRVPLTPVDGEEYI